MPEEQIRFSEVLKNIGVELAHEGKGKEGATLLQQIRAAGAAAEPKWRKSGDLNDLEGFLAALPGRSGRDLLGALNKEIRARGEDWARAYLFDAIREHCAPLKDLGAPEPKRASASASA